jgi:hypothetical protein
MGITWHCAYHIVSDDSLYQALRTIGGCGKSPGLETKGSKFFVVVVSSFSFLFFEIGSCYIA